MQKDLKNKSLQELRELVSEYDKKAFQADYIFSFIHDKKCLEISAISPLPKAFREQLSEEGYHIGQIEILKRLVDPDETIKYLFRLEDGHCVEAVRLQDGKRITLCISCQVGCRMGCGFCATGQIQFKRNLTSGEIVDQVYQIEAKDGRCQNIVYMGMGEPLDNFDEVQKSLQILNHPKGRNIGIRHITISTCGMCEEIRQLAAIQIHPRLAISLHAAQDYKRDQIMPINKSQPITELIKAIEYYQRETGRRITFEYCMIRDINDGKQDAQKLVSLIQSIKDLKANVNLIEFNEFEGCDYRSSSQNRIKSFAEILNKAGIETVIRFKRGRTINAACGQLGAQSY